MSIFKKYFYSFIILAATVLLFLFLYTQYTQKAFAATATTPPSGTYVEGEIFVQYSQSVFDAHQIAVHRTSSDSDSDSSRPSVTDPVKVVKDFFVDEKYTPTVIGTLYDLQAQLITIEKNGNAGEPLNYAAKLRKLPGVVHVQPNFLYELESSPNDHWIKDSGVAFKTKTGSIDGMWHLKSIQAHDPNSTDDAWDLIDSLTGRTYKPRVAVIDDGIATSYTEFSGSIRSQSCKIPEFSARVFGLGGDEKIEYTPKTKTCPEAGVGFRKNTALLKLSPLLISYDVDPVSKGDHDHGTSVASVLMSHRNNDPGSTFAEESGAGVAGGMVDLIPIRLYVKKNDKFDSYSIVQAIAFARLNNVDIINASLGSTHKKDFCGDGIDLLTYKQIKKFGDSGGLFITTAGNKDSKTGGGDSTHFPSDFNHTNPRCSKWTGLSSEMIVVGGVEKSDNSDDPHQGNSNATYPDIEHDINGDGKTSAAERDIMSIPGTIQEIRWNRDWTRKDGTWVGSDYNHKVNIAAPAKSIAVPESPASLSAEPDRSNGTSLAAPQVAGTLALMKYANPALSASVLKQRLEESADELISLVGPDCTPGTTDDYVERGRRLNAYNAVQAALGNEYTKKTISHSDRGACLCAGSPNCEYGECGVGVNTCLSGTPHDDDAPDTTTRYRWVCRGKNGGINSETCSAPREGGCADCTTDLGSITSTVTRPNQTLVNTCNSESRPGKHASYYTFTLRSAAEVTIDLTSDTIDMYLFLHKHDGAKQCGVGKNEDSNDDRGGDRTTHSRITKSLTAGTYIIEATTFYTGRTGSFDLKITPTFACATAIDGGWTTLPTASTITCGTTQTAKCDNPAPSCGGSQCSGNAPSVTGTKCTTGYICSAGSCVKDPPICTGCAAWKDWTPPITNQCGDVKQKRDCKTLTPAGCVGSFPPENRTETIPTINGGWSDTTWGTCTCTASKADSASAGTQTGTRTCTNPTRNRCGADCSGSATPTRTCTVSAGNCPVTPPTCTGCAAWKDWTPPITNQCGDVKQKRDCKTLTPAGCVGSFPPENRTETIPTINGGWSDTTWGTCTCTASKADSASAGTQTGTRTCTNPTRNRCGADCSGSATPTRTCTVSAGNCPVTPVSCTSCTTNLGTLTSTVTKADQSLITTCNSESRPGKHAKYYTFTLRSAAEVTIDLTSDTIDTYLYLHKHDGAKQCGVGKEEDSNDDRGGDSTTHSRITKSLTAGTYIIEATTYYSNRTGSFDLKVAPTCTTAIDGGWTTLPAASTITCGTTQTATCENPAPSCGGSQCSGNAPTVTGTKCSTGNICSAGSCIPSCTTAPTPSTFTVTAGDTTLRADFTLFNNLYAYQRAISDSSATCAGSTWGVESDGHQDYTNLINGKTYYICLRSRWKEGACKNDWSASRVVTGTPTATAVTCTSCQTWNPWYPAIVNQCGDVDQTRSCDSKLPAGCTGRIANQNRTYTVPETDGGWSDTTWGTCTCTASKADSASAGTQTGTRTCTNPTPNRCGADCSGSTTPTRTCTVSAGNCPVTPTSTSCSWQRVSCGTKVCGPQQAVCGPTGCTGTCPYTNDTTAQPGDTGTYANGCGTCSNGETCNSSGQCTTPSVACSWQNNSCTNKCGTITGTCGPTGCTGTCRYTNDRRAQPGDTGTRNCGSCSSGYTCSNNTCVKNPTTRVDGGWSSWSSCTCTSQTNDGNAGTQTRTCTNPAPSGGGSACSGSSSQDCTASGCDTTSSCSSRPCSTSCRSSITWGSCHAGHTHSGGYQHTQPQRHGSYTCHGSSTIRWTSENCTLSSCGAWSNRYCGTAGNNTNKVRRHRDCSGVRQWETVEDCSASNKTCLAGYCF